MEEGERGLQQSREITNAKETGHDDNYGDRGEWRVSGQGTNEGESGSVQDVRQEVKDGYWMRLAN